MTESMINALIQATPLSVIALAVLYQNRILKTKVETQKGIIDAMKAFQDVFDPAKVKEYVSLREQTFKDYGEKKHAEEKKFFDERLDAEITAINNNVQELASFYRESASALMVLLSDMPIKARNEIYEKHLHQSGDSIRKVVEGRIERRKQADKEFGETLAVIH